PRSTLFPYTALFRPGHGGLRRRRQAGPGGGQRGVQRRLGAAGQWRRDLQASEELRGRAGRRAALGGCRRLQPGRQAGSRGRQLEFRLGRRAAGQRRRNLQALRDLPGGGHAVTVLQGNGDGSFVSPPQTYTFDGDPESIAIEDFNGDGIPDLAVANDDTAGTVAVLLGNGGGTFQAAQKYQVGGINSES